MLITSITSITSYASDKPKAAGSARFCARLRLLALLPASISLLIPATALGDIFKWTDEAGRVNISNVPPPASVKAKDVELVLKESKPAPVPQHLATSTEQALLTRIEGLERQLQTRQYAPPAPAPAQMAPPPAPYPGYYPPPPSSSYYSSGYAGSYTTYYPRYTYPIASSYVVYPARTYIAQPAFARSGSGHAHTGGAHGGRR